MSAELASPPFHLDVRVAESPVVGMRFLLDGRVSELREIVDTIDETVSDLSVRSRLLRSVLARSDSAWRAALANLTQGGAEHAITTRAADMFEICTEIARVETKAEGMIERRKAMCGEIKTLRNLSSMLLELDVIELRGVAQNGAARFVRAERQLGHIAEHEHAAMARRVVMGPLQQLSDFTASLEVVERGLEARDAGVVGEFRRCAASLNEALVAMRREMSMLRSPRNAESCVDILRSIVTNLDAATGRVDIIGDADRMSEDQLGAVAQIAQEAARNAVAHGRAQRVDIVLSVGAGLAVLVVRDDGDGFDVAATQSRLGRTQGMGMLIMRERAQLAGGSLDIRSAVDTGSEVRATFPIRA